MAREPLTGSAPTLPPYFRARKRDGGFDVEGTPRGELGHRLPDGDGIFASWSWDGERLTVENDRYGFYPLFYRESEDEIALSASLAELLRRGAPAELDEVALAVFRSLGFFLGEDTPFRRIKVVPPGARFEWDGRLAVEERRPRPVGHAIEITRDEAAREFARLFREAVRRRAERAERFAVALSGGRDSRHIVLALCELGRPPAFCATVTRHPPIDDGDVEAAAALTERLGIEHVVVPQLPRFQAEYRKNLETHFLANEGAWYVAVADQLERSVDTAFHGLCGDAFASSTWQRRDLLDLHRDGRLGELADHFAQGGSQSHSPFLRAAEVRRLVRERVVRELERYADAPNPLTMFAFWNCSRRKTSLLQFGIGTGVATCFCPYLDHAVYDFLTSLPPEITLDRRFHAETIASAYPRLADVPFAGPARKHHLRRHYASFAARVGWYGISRRPARAPSWAVGVARMALAVLDPGYHDRHEVDTPEWMLYTWQLEDLVRGYAGSTKVEPSGETRA